MQLGRRKAMKVDELPGIIDPRRRARLRSNGGAYCAAPSLPTQCVSSSTSSHYNFVNVMRILALPKATEPWHRPVCLGSSSRSACSSSATVATSPFQIAEVALSR